MNLHVLKIKKESKQLLMSCTETVLKILLEQGCPPGEEAKLAEIKESMEGLINKLQVSLETDDIEMTQSEAAAYMVVEHLMRSYNDFLKNQKVSPGNGTVH